MFLTLMKLGDLSGKGSNLVGLITRGSTLLVLSDKNSLDFTVSLMFRESFAAEAKLSIAHSQCAIFSSVCCISKKKKMNHSNRDSGAVTSEMCQFVTLNVGLIGPLLVGELFSGMFTERAHFKVTGKNTCQVEAFLPISCDQCMQSKQFCFPAQDN